MEKKKQFPVFFVVIKQGFHPRIDNYIPLSNRGRGPYWKLPRDRVFFPSIYGSSAKRADHKSKGKKRGSVTYSTDRENAVSKIFIISLLFV